MSRDFNDEIKVGDVFERKVKKIIKSGLFIELTKGRDGYLHISQVAKNVAGDSPKRIDRIEDYVQEGDMLTVRVQEIAEDGRIRLENVTQSGQS